MSSSVEADQVLETYWRRVRYNGEGDGLPPPWKLQAVDGKGYVALATRNFTAGEWICSEFPVVWIHGHHPFNEEQNEEITKKVNELQQEDKDAFFGMANVFSNIEDDYTAEAGIFMTNCFDMTDSIYGECCAMYLALARLNHSCTPNAQQTHMPETTEEVLYAVRDIGVGEEINDCYIDLRQCRSYRRESLQEYYRFFCECQGCNLPSEELQKQDDLARVKLDEYSDIAIGMIETGDQYAALEYILKVGKLMENNENHVKWSARYLSEIYLYAYQIADSLNEKKLAKENLLKAHQWNVKLQGKLSPDSLKTNRLLLSLTN